MITLGDLAALGRQPYYGPGTTGKTDTPQVAPAGVKRQPTPATGGYRYSGQGDHETEQEFFERMRRSQSKSYPHVSPETRGGGRYGWSAQGARGDGMGPTMVNYPPEPTTEPPLRIEWGTPAGGLPCPDCGAKTSENSAYCPNCGRRLPAGRGAPAPWIDFRSPVSYAPNPGALFYASQARPSYQVRQATPVQQAQQYRMPTYLVPGQRTSAAAYYGAGASYGRLGNMPMGMPPSSSLPQVPGLPSMRIRIADGDLGTKQTLENMGKLAVEASRDPRWIDYARSVISGLPNKDYGGEAQRFFDHVADTIRYTKDPTGMELIQDPRWTQFVWGQGDCFVKGTKVLLRAGHRLVPIESLRIGDEVWGRDRWSRVENTWDRGMRPTYMVLLNNGSSMRLTPEHKVWVAQCERHTARTKPCACPVSERNVVRVTVEELKPKDVLVTPDKVECGAGEMDPRRAYIEGLYAADGYQSHEGGAGFQISGRDGFPREEQKREVQALCKDLGIETTWWYNAISVSERDWADRVAAMGTLSWNKHFLSLDHSEPVVRELLRGVLVDSGRNSKGAGRTFTTSSRELFLQVRVLLKMLGMNCSSSYVPDHGSTSERPVWRLAIRQNATLDSLGVIRDRAWRALPPKSFNPEHSEKLLRVREVIRDNAEQDCFDIATDDHCVWLPEADWTTSQCDDHSTMLAALALSVGLGAAFRTVGVDVAGIPPEQAPWSHVYAVLGVPEGNRVSWIGADTTQPGGYLGWEPRNVARVGTWVISQPG